MKCQLFVINNFKMDNGNILNYKLEDHLYFNVNKKNGRWCYSTEPMDVEGNETISQLDEWDNLIKTIVVNITDSCNINCVYCSRQCARKKPGNMDLTLTKKLLKKSSQYAIKNNSLMTIQFHGGEPLLEFNKILESVDSLTPEEKNHLKLRIQTNGTLITEKIVKNCQERNIEIGISLDGRKIENDLTRKDAKNLGTFDKIKEALKLIKKYQKEISCLTVVTNINVNNLDKILNYFNEIGLNNVGFLPLYEEPRTRTIKKDMVPDMKTLAINQKVLFDKWIELLKDEKNNELNISTFQILIWNILSSNTSVQKFRINCGVGINSLFVEDDGSVWGCGAFSYADELKIGDFNTDTLEEMQEGGAYKMFKERITSNTKKCKDCALQFICKGGCVANGFQKDNDIFETDIWCPYWAV